MLELERFEKLYSDEQEDLAGSQIDPEIILGRQQKTTIIPSNPKMDIEEPKFRMAARKGGSAVPKHVMDKIKKNQDKRKQDDSGTAQEGA
jgi:hypothetical protein